MRAAPPSAEPLTLVPLSSSELNGDDQLLQTGFWGGFKAAAGWRPMAFEWNAGGDFNDLSGRFLVLERSFPGGLKMAYVPYGPALPAKGIAGNPLEPGEAGVLLQAIATKLKRHLSRGCFVIRFDLCGGTRGPVGTDVPRPRALPAPLRRAPYRVQPPDTVILALVDSDGAALSEEALLAGMHKKTRYNIRLADRKGVEVRRLEGVGALEGLASWYALYRETGRRDGISLHPESYYRRLFEMASAGEEKAPGMALYMASHDGEDLAGIIVSRSGKRSVYMYGASSSRKRELMPNHLLQWSAIRDALAEGAAEYDFFGIPPADDPGHPMHGLWRFKTGFGGQLVHYLGAWDYPQSPFLYRLYAAAENTRGRLAVLRKKR